MAKATYPTSSQPYGIRTRLPGLGRAALQLLRRSDADTGKRHPDLPNVPLVIDYAKTHGEKTRTRRNQ